MLKTAFPFKGTDTVNSLVLGANFTPDDQTRQAITRVYFFLSVHLLICFYPTQLHRGLLNKKRKKHTFTKVSLLQSLYYLKDKRVSLIQ